MFFNKVGEIAFIEDNANVKQCIDILGDKLSNSALKLRISNSHYFQQDDDSKHNACVTKLRLLYYIQNL